MSSCENIYVV